MYTKPQVKLYLLKFKLLVSTHRKPEGSELNGTKQLHNSVCSQLICKCNRPTACNCRSQMFELRYTYEGSISVLYHGFALHFYIFSVFSDSEISHAYLYAPHVLNSLFV
jgi:hypothetical protein